MSFSSNYNFSNVLTSSFYKIQTLPANNDNQMQVIHDTQTNNAVCIDPCDALAVANYCTTHHLNLVYSLTTHNHWDHSGGNAHIKSLTPQVTVVGGRDDGCPAVQLEVNHNDSLTVDNFTITGLATPFHTPGHVCQLIEDRDGVQSVFTGDCMFVSGCGNLNDGSKAQLLQAFLTLSKLKDECLVQVGHEQTWNNLRFARSILPQHEGIESKFRWAEDCKKSGTQTVPSTIKEEKELNPFMMAALQQNDILQISGVDNNEDAIYWVRMTKNKFK